MSEDDVLFGYRLQLLDLRGADDGQRGLSGLRGPPLDLLPLEAPGGAARPGDAAPAGAAPAADAQPAVTVVEERIVAFALAPSGPRTAADRAELARAHWGGIVVSAQRRLALPAPPRPQHALQAALAGRRLRGTLRTAARARRPSAHIEVDHPGELVGFDCFYVGRLTGTTGAVWQLTAIDSPLLVRLGGARRVPHWQPDRLAQTSKLARRVARDLEAAGWRLERVLTDNGNEFRSIASRARSPRSASRHTCIRAGRPQTNGDVEALHAAHPRGVLATGLRALPLPPLHGPQARARRTTSPTTTSTASTTAASPVDASPRHRLRCPQDGDEMSRKCRHISESVQPKSSAFRCVYEEVSKFRRNASPSRTIIATVLLSSEPPHEASTRGPRRASG